MFPLKAAVSCRVGPGPSLGEGVLPDATCGRSPSHQILYVLVSDKALAVTPTTDIGE